MRARYAEDSDDREPLRQSNSRDDSSSYQQQQPLEPQPQPQDQMPMPAGQVGAKKDGCCDSLMNKLRSSLAYHVFMFTLHYVGFLAAISTSLVSYLDSDGFSAHSAVSLGGIIAIAVDVYLLDKHYREETYFPFCAAPHLLFIVKRKRVDPGPPPNETLWLSDKLLIIMQGYIFVVIPLNNLIASLDRSHGHMSDAQKVVFLIVVIQLAVTLVGWFLLSVFMMFFFFELFIRFFCCPCCMFRPRRRVSPPPPTDGDWVFFASHSSDPLFYNLYAWLFENI